MSIINTIIWSAMATIVMYLDCILSDTFRLRSFLLLPLFWLNRNNKHSFKTVCIDLFYLDLNFVRDLLLLFFFTTIISNNRQT